MKVLYTKILLNNYIPDKKVYIDNDWDSVYYMNDGSKHKLSVLDMSKYQDLFSFLKIKKEVRNEYNSPSVYIYLDINTKKIKKELTNPIEFSYKRKQFFNLINKCYLEKVYTYIHNMIMKLFKDAMNIDNYLSLTDYNISQPIFNYHKNSLKWIYYIENNRKNIYYSYKEPYIKVAQSLYINSEKCRIDKVIEKDRLKLKGGIMINSYDNTWIYDFVNMTFIDNFPKYRINGFIRNNATLFIVSKEMCNMYKIMIEEVLLKYNSTRKITIINNSYQTISYGDILNSDYVIVSSSYLSSKLYKSLWKPYHSDNTSLKETFENLRRDYVDQPNIRNFKNPILSLFWWRRIVIDDFTINKMVKDTEFKEVMLEIRSYYRWIQIEKFPLIKEDVITYFEYLFERNNIVFPLYDYRDRELFLENIIKIHTENTLIKENNRVIEKITIQTNNTDTENMVLSHFKPYMNKNKNVYLDKMYSLILPKNAVQKKLVLKCNNMLRNLKKNINNGDIRNISNVLSYVKNNKDNDVCSICLDNEKDRSITSCSHEFCTQCINSHLLFQSLCPICKSSITQDSIYRVDNGVLSSKIKSLIDYLGKNIKNSAIITNYDINYVKKIIENNNFKGVLFKGTKLKKNKIIKKFNDMSGNNNVIIMNNKDNKYMFQIRNIEQLIIMDDNKYCSINDSIEKLKIVNIVYT